MKRHATLSQARALRRRAPSTEHLLWTLLRGRRLEGLKFRRQVLIGPYIVDFLCLRHRLIVEADGPFHEPEDDAVRDAWSETQGFRVLRFPNGEIQNRDWLVVGRILAAIAVRQRPGLSDPSSVSHGRHLLPQGEKG